MQGSIQTPVLRAIDAPPFTGPHFDVSPWLLFGVSGDEVWSEKKGNLKGN
jgi:hypothetical protein